MEQLPGITLETYKEIDRSLVYELHLTVQESASCLVMCTRRQA